MNILEKDIEDIIYGVANSDDQYLLAERGLDLLADVGDCITLRQHRLGNYGIMDIVFIGYCPYDKEFMIDVLELKKDAIDYNTLDQAFKYKRGIEQYMKTAFPNAKYAVRTHLIGKHINLETSSICYVPNIIPEFKLYIYKLDFKNGLQFEEIEDYCLSNPGFNKMTTEISSKIRGMVKMNYRLKIS